MIIYNNKDIILLPLRPIIASTPINNSFNPYSPLIQAWHGKISLVSRIIAFAIFDTLITNV